MIKVTTMGAATKEVPFEQGMTVGDALKAAGVEKTDKATVTVNGKDAKLKTVLSDSDIVVITPNISNG